MKKALVLSKETLRTLDEQDLSLVAGGHGGYRHHDDHYGYDHHDYYDWDYCHRHRHHHHD